MNHVKNLGKIMLVLFCWLMLFFLLTILTDFTLAPWDTAIERPEVGTWQRSLNDFFENPPGQYVLSVPIVLVSIYLTLSAIRRNPATLNRLVVIHLLFIPTLVLVWLAAINVNNRLHPYPPVMYDPNYLGYHRSIIPLTALVILCLVWFVQQVRLAKSTSDSMLRG